MHTRHLHSLHIFSPYPHPFKIFKCSGTNTSQPPTASINRCATASTASTNHFCRFKRQVTASTNALTNCRDRFNGQVYDCRALRVIVDDEGGERLQEAVEACYRLVSVVHSIWRAIPREFDDYIANPKPSGYQALHTGVRLASMEERDSK